MNPNPFLSLQKKKLFLFDIDGTLAVGDTLYEGSAELLDHIRSIGGKAYYITNNSTKSGRDYVEKFRSSFHLETTEDQFITTGALCRQERLRPGHRLLYHGASKERAAHRRDGTGGHQLRGGCLRQRADLRQAGTGL